MTKSHEHARLLMEKSAEDEYVLERLSKDDNASNTVIGFHAQQAVEKLMKAVLTDRSIQYRRTHDLWELLDLLQEHKISLPPEAEKLPNLTPYAAEFRYDRLPPDPEDMQRFDREWAVECVKLVKGWAESIIGFHSKPE